MNRTEYEQVSPEVILRTTLWGGSEKLRRERRKAYREGYDAGLYGGYTRLPVGFEDHFWDGWTAGKEAKHS